MYPPGVYSAGVFKEAFWGTAPAGVHVCFGADTLCIHQNIGKCYGKVLTAISKTCPVPNQGVIE